MNLEELKSAAKQKKAEQDYESALGLYEQIWIQEKNEWNSYYLAQCSRKEGKYDRAHELLNFIDINFPSFLPAKNERLWLEYSEKIKDWNNENLIEDAENLISRADQYDKYSGAVYTKTILRVVRHLLYVQNLSKALEWLNKLDQAEISNTIYNFQGQVYPADRKVYFILLADVLIKLNQHVDYIENYLTKLSFHGIKHTEFKKYIIESITFDNYISRVRLALFIKNFQEEISIRKKNDFNEIYNSEKITLISDLSHFLFCPVSFAINATFEIKPNSTWEKDEWLGEKRLLIQRYSIFQQNKSYKESFADSQIVLDSELERNFRNIFDSTLLVNNTDNSKPTIYSNTDNTLIGTPDYIFQDTEGNKFSLTEKFSSINSSDARLPFESDLVKHYAFLEELKSLNLKYGIFLTWYWQLIDVNTDNGQVKKKIVVSSYRLTKITSTPDNLQKLNRTIDLVHSFKRNKSMTIDGNKISYPNKCLNCSVINYCNHKTGNYNQINLPYNLAELKLDNG